MNELKVNTNDVIMLNRWRLELEEKNVYLSGPISYDIDQAKEDFAIVYSHVIGTFRAKCAFDPANAPIFENPQGNVFLSLDHEDYMAICITELCKHKLELIKLSYVSALVRRGFYDVILMLPGYQDSPGAMVELAVATSLDMDIVFWDDILASATPNMRRHLERGVGEDVG